MKSFSMPLAPPWDTYVLRCVSPEFPAQAFLKFAVYSQFGDPQGPVKMRVHYNKESATKALGGDKYFIERSKKISELTNEAKKTGRKIFEVMAPSHAQTYSPEELNLLVAHLFRRVLVKDSPERKLSPRGQPVCVDDWFEFAFLSYLCPNHPHAPLGKAAWACFQHGFLPLRWRGTFPEGYFEAYAVPGWSPAEVPEACRPASLKVARVPRAKPKRWPTPEVAVVPPRLWPVGLTGPALVTAVTRHLSHSATSDQDRELAAQVAAHAQGARLVPARSGTPGEALELTFRTVSGEVLTLTAQPPWTGRLTGLTPDLAQVVRVHNGFEALCSPGKGMVADWFAFDGKGFAVEWDVWYQGDEDDPEDVFAKPPLAPCQDQGGLHLLHPTERGPDGLPTLQYWTHGGGRRPSSAPTAWTAFLDALVLGLS